MFLPFMLVLFYCSSTVLFLTLFLIVVIENICSFNFVKRFTRIQINKVAQQAISLVYHRGFIGDKTQKLAVSR